MSDLITLDEAIDWGKRGELCDLMTEDDQLQVAEWLRQARGANAAGRWYTARLRELKDERDMYRGLVEMMDHPDLNAQLQAENAKLRELVDAWMGCGTRYHTMQGACPMFDPDASDFCKASQMARELGIEVS